MLFSPKTTERSAEVPRFFRLPADGQRDPYFSLTRRTYLRLEKAGGIKLARMTLPGKDRGSVLVEFSQVLGYLSSLTTIKCK